MAKWMDISKIFVSHILFNQTVYTHHMASSCLHWVTRLVLTMLPPQMTMMTGAPGLTPLSCSDWPSSPEYAEASTEPQAISTNIRWSSANLSHEMSSKMHVIFHRSIDMIVTINGVIRYQNEIYCTSSYLTQAAFASLSDTSMDITRSGCKQFLVYFSVLFFPAAHLLEAALQQPVRHPEGPEASGLARDGLQGHAGARSPSLKHGNGHPSPSVMFPPTHL